MRPGLFGSVFVQGARDVPGLQHTAHGGACVSSSGSAAVMQWVVVFPKRLRYFLDRDADCLKRVAGIAVSEVQRAPAGASTSTAAAGRSGGVLFVHRFGATLNAHVHLHLCILDGVVAQGRQGLVFRGAH